VTTATIATIRTFGAFYPQRILSVMRVFGFGHWNGLVG
jgi:hypothetical protein